MTGPLPEPVAEVIEDGRVRISRGRWSMEFPATALRGRIAFYRTLMARDRGRHADTYAPEVAALARIALQIEAQS